MLYNSHMTEFLERLSTWLDPRFLGEIAVAWSGRVLAAFAIFIIDRLFLKALTRWATIAMRRVGLAPKTPDNRIITVPQAKSVIGAIVAAEPRLAKYPAAEVAVQDVFPALVTIAVRVWVASTDYGNVRSDLLERIKRALDKYGLSLTAEQRAVPAAQLVASK